MLRTLLNSVLYPSIRALRYIGSPKVRVILDDLASEQSEDDNRVEGPTVFDPVRDLRNVAAGLILSAPVRLWTPADLFKAVSRGDPQSKEIATEVARNLSRQDVDRLLSVCILNRPTKRSLAVDVLLIIANRNQDKRTTILSFLLANMDAFDEPERAMIRAYGSQGFADTPRKTTTGIRGFIGALSAAFVELIKDHPVASGFVTTVASTGLLFYAQMSTLGKGIVFLGVLFGVIATLATGVIASALYEWIRDLRE